MSDYGTWMWMQASAVMGTAPGPGGPPRATEQGGPAGDGTTTAPGTPATPQGGGGPGGPGGGNNFLFLVFILLGVMLLFTVLGQRRERKKREALMSAVKKHDKVQTVGGVIGSVVEVKGNTVVLKVDESSNTRITFARSAIQQVLSTGAEGGEAAK